MARRRVIDPAFWMNEDLASLSAHARLLYIGLWGIVDDNHATCPNRPDWIRAQVFPYETVDTHTLLNELSVSGHISLFQGDDGKEYWFIPTFFTYQTINRPSKPKYPAFQKDKSIIKNEENRKLSEDSVSTHPEVKLSKEKLSKDNREASPKFSNGNGGHVGEILANKKIPTASNAAVTHSWQDTALRYAKELNINLDLLDGLKDLKGNEKGYRGRWFKIFKEGKSKQLQNAYSALADDPKWESKSQEHRILLFFWIYNGNTVKAFESLQKSIK